METITAKARILVVDDEKRMRQLMKDYLTVNHYNVIEAGDGQEALDIFYSDKHVDLIILDVMMPRVSGLEVLKEIRESSDVPIILLTAKSQEEDELLGLNLGADHYITKPFSLSLLKARVEAMLRRTMADNSKLIVVGGIKIDRVGHSVYVNDEEVNLSVKEFDLLVYLAENRGITLTRERILDHVWNYDYYGDARTIDTHMTKLRKKLGPCGEYLTTKRGVGYRLDTENIT